MMIDIDQVRKDTPGIAASVTLGSERTHAGAAEPVRHTSHDRSYCCPANPMSFFDQSSASALR